MKRADVARCTRRSFLGTSFAVAALPQTDTSAIDFHNLISRADLIYDKPVPRSEEGIPVGNGRMGTLVWTTPTQLRMQINRVDVYASDSRSNSFFERHNDYCGGCGFVDLDFGTTAAEPFPESGFRQHLSVYDGQLAINAKDVDARVFAWPEQDVLAISISDRRAGPQPVEVNLRMLRYASQYFGGKLEAYARDHVVVVQNRSHTAASRLIIEGDSIVLTQEFREGEFCCKSAVAIRITGRTAKARITTETEVRLAAAPGSGTCTILIASAATFDPNGDAVASALQQLDAAANKGLAALVHETQAWWHDFWPRGYVSLHSADGVADYVESHYHYFLYLMASTSRGKFPPKFNGMIWNTGGDLRTWGVQHWFANLSCYYEALPATNRMELLDPAFDMYSGMLEASRVAAQQQWGSQGMYIPETTYFNGLESLPDDIAAEMRELYLLRKPWEQRSKRFKEFASTKHPHSSRWNWQQSGSWVDGRYVVVERGSGPYGAVNHIFGSSAKIAYLFWRRYEYTLDREWLRQRAYPMLHGAAEFYRNYPNLKKGADGKYHIHHVNSNESVWGARDTDEDLSSLRGVLAAVLRASEILGADANLRPAWREFLANLAPLPTSADAEALKPADYKGPQVFVRGRKPAIKSAGLLPDANSLPMWWFDLCHQETRDRARLQIANATFDAYFRSGISEQTSVSVLSKLAIAAAYQGRADAVRHLIPNQIKALSPERGTAYRDGGVLANRMTLREGPQALDAQRLGRVAEALQLALLQSNPPEPGEEPVIHLFPAWPKDWTAHFRLRARGAFLVNASIANGRIDSVTIESQAGAPCVLRNPWGDAAVQLRREGKTTILRGGLLRFPTSPGERIVLIAQ